MNARAGDDKCQQSDSGSEPSDDEEFFNIKDYRAHSEYMTLKQLNNFT